MLILIVNFRSVLFIERLGRNNKTTNRIFEGRSKRNRRIQHKGSSFSISDIPLISFFFSSLRNETCGNSNQNIVIIECYYTALLPWKINFQNSKIRLEVVFIRFAGKWLRSSILQRISEQIIEILLSGNIQEYQYVRKGFF